MIYAGDEYVPLPTKDLYDTQMMLAAVNAAKDMYEKADKKYEDFVTKYENFYSPSSEDTKFVYNNTIKAVNDKINELYLKGQDPFRSSIGRAEIQQLIRGVPVGEIRNRMLSALNMLTYNKNTADLIKDDKYNPILEGMLTNGKTPQNWNTSVDGVWMRETATPFRNIVDIISPAYKNLGQDQNLGADPNNPGYDLYGSSDEYIDNADANAFNTLKNDPSYILYKKAVTDQLKSNPTYIKDANAIITYDGDQTSIQPIDDNYIDKQIFELYVKPARQQFVLPKSVINPKYEAELKAKYTKTPVTKVVVNNSGDGGSVQTGNILENTMAAYLNDINQSVDPSNTESGELNSYDTLLTQLKVKYNDNAESMINDQRLYRRIPRDYVTENITGKKSTSFTLTSGMIDDALSVDELFINSSTNKGNTIRKEITDKTNEFVSDGFRSVSAAPTGKIVIADRGSGQIGAYAELVINLPGKAEPFKTNDGTNVKDGRTLRMKSSKRKVYVDMSVYFNNDHNNPTVTTNSIGGQASDVKGTRGQYGSSTKEVTGANKAEHARATSVNKNKNNNNFNLYERK